jgi:hypothetical protein
MANRVIVQALLVGVLWCPLAPAAEVVRRLPVADYIDHMQGGWIGQMAGVGWGAPTEFKTVAAIIPEAQMPAWNPEMVNQHGNDDLYVEMTFLKSLADYGLGVPIRQAGIDFANSGYGLWHANLAGRDNLRQGIAPPDSGHPRFNAHADDIDYQIEADFSGLIAPGLPNQAIALGEIFGRLMNYGDGLYGGQFVGGMYAEAFFEADPVKLVEFGLRCIPAQSQYAECVRDVLAWSRENPDDWTRTWQKVEDKYQKNPAYRRFSCDKGAFNIDAKINGAYIVMGLLYGRGDLDRTLTIACRCGQDSDCNPANAGGILFAALGASKIPARFTEKLNAPALFYSTPYSLPKVYEVCLALARAAVLKAGGRLETDAAGAEVFVIPTQTPMPSAFEPCWAPGPAAQSRFTPEELARIKPPPPPVQRCAPADIAAAVQPFAPGWTAQDCGADMAPGLRPQWGGRTNVLVTHPLSSETGCVLSRQVPVPADRKTALHLVVANDPRGDFELVVRGNGKDLRRQTVAVNNDTKQDGWLDLTVDLSPFAGRTVTLEVVNQPTGWAFEAAYWASLTIETP